MSSLNAFEQIYLRRAKNPLKWQDAAIPLRDAASVIASKFAQAWEDLQAPEPQTTRHHEAGDTLRMLPVHNMLMGYALENLLKGLLVAQGHRPVELIPPKKLEKAKHKAGDRLQLSKEFKTHNIRELAVRAGVDLSPKELEVLGRVSATIVAARYPISTEVERPDSPEAFGRTSWSKDPEILSSLCERVDKKLVETCLQNGAKAIEVPPPPGSPEAHCKTVYCWP